MKLQHAEFAMHGHEVLRLDESLHEAEFLTGGVAGGVEGEGEGILLHLGAHLDEFVDKTVDQSPITRNRVGGEDDGVARIDRGVLVVTGDDAGKGRHGLALGTRADDADLRHLVVAEHVVLDDLAIGDLDVAVFPGDADDVFHGAAHDADLPIVLQGDLDDLLDTVDVAREGRDDDAPGGVIENLVDARPDRGFARGVAFNFGVGGVRHQ